MERSEPRSSVAKQAEPLASPVARSVKPERRHLRAPGTREALVLVTRTSLATEGMERSEPRLSVGNDDELLASSVVRSVKPERSHARAPAPKSRASARDPNVVPEKADGVERTTPCTDDAPACGLHALFAA
jgi:hypothetical protein